MGCMQCEVCSVQAGYRRREGRFPPGWLSAYPAEWRAVLQSIYCMYILHAVQCAVCSVKAGYRRREGLAWMAAGSRPAQLGWWQAVLHSLYSMYIIHAVHCALCTLQCTGRLQEGWGSPGWLLAAGLPSLVAGSFAVYILYVYITRCAVCSVHFAVCSVQAGYRRREGLAWMAAGSWPAQLDGGQFYSLYIICVYITR